VSTRRFAGEIRLAFALLLVVGLGSIAFHGTLRFELQMLDELPMLYLVTWLVWLLVENGPTRRLGRWFPAALVGYVLLATAGATLNRGGAQFLAFHVSFGALEIFSSGGWHGSPSVRRTGRCGGGSRSGSPRTRRGSRSGSWI
jgi:hypothetical protein